MVELKTILKHLREEKQVSMDKMCEDLNSSYNMSLAKSTISKWENGKAEPSLSYARILTKYFNVTLDYLLGLEKEETYSFNETKNLSKDEEILLSNFNKLNDLGKKEANKRVAELTEINKYIKENNTFELITATKYEIPAALEDIYTTIAAHDDNLTDDEKLEADRRILAALKKMKK